MTDSIQSQIEKLTASIKGLEAQRTILGDEIVNPALAALHQQLVILEQQASSVAAPIEERRMVSILFIDMVGSTSMAEKYDPEEYRKIVSRLHTSLSGVIAAHHGTVAQYLGDGLLAFFGSKRASEHDPENAIRAALEGHSAIASLSWPEPVQIRAGIHTGLVVVGELGDAVHKEFTASGDAMNLAARLQAAAPPGGTLISHDTYRYVRGVFDLTPRPPLIVKGKGEPIQTYLVRRAKQRPFRSLSRGVAGVETRTIGREAEMKTLQDAYLRAYNGHGVIWTQLMSDPGIGKTRLLVDLYDWIDLREETTRLLRARAFPDDSNQPFALIRRMWFDRFQIAEDIPLEQAEARWVERFKEFSGQEKDDEAAHALGLLVGLPFLTSPYIKSMRNDPTQVKGRALVVSRALVKSARQQSPMVVLLEDLQWTDAASWEYLTEVFLNDDNDVMPNGLFILGAARPEWHPPHALLKHFESSSAPELPTNIGGTLIDLAPLSDQDIRELAKELLQQVDIIPEQVINLLVERSEGVPYFTEEMINWFIDHEILDTSGEKWCFSPEKLREQPLPSTLQHLLLTRLSSLSPAERAALQRGAIFGRRFWTGGVEALGVTAGSEMLGHLQPRGFVDAQPDSVFLGDKEWSFHQNLLQEVTYESVLKRERLTLHKIAATWLENQARQAGRLDEFAGLLGDHYERAGELGAAADWYLRAGSHAYNQGAPHEAMGSYTKALDLLPPVDRERRWKALSGRQDALAILGDAELEKADISALIELAQDFGDDNYLAEAYLRQAMLGTRLADVSIYDEASRLALVAAHRCGNEGIEVKALAISALVDLYKGDNASSTGKCEEALNRARILGDDNVLSYILYRVAYIYSALRINSGEELLIEKIDLDHHLGNRSQEALGIGNLAAGYQGVGLLKQARGMLEQVVQIDQALGARRGLAYALVNLGDIYKFSGDLRKAREFVEQAYREIYPTQDALGTAAILWSIGDVLLMMGDASAATRRFTEAHDIATAHNVPAKACESTISLASCEVSMGHLDQARIYIEEAWDYFKEHGYKGMTDPGSAYLTCAEVFDALGDEENFQDVLDVGHKAFIEVVNKISVPERRKSVQENIPDNRSFMELWERRKR